MVRDAMAMIGRPSSGMPAERASGPAIAARELLHQLLVGCRCSTRSSMAFLFSNHAKITCLPLVVRAASRPRGRPGVAFEHADEIRKRRARILRAQVRQQQQATPTRTTTASAAAISLQCVSIHGTASCIDSTACVPREFSGLRRKARGSGRRVEPAGWAERRKDDERIHPRCLSWQFSAEIR